MRGHVVAAAVSAALAVGGVPGLVLTSAGGRTVSMPAAAEVAAARRTDMPESERREQGPPPWARSKARDKDRDEAHEPDADEARPGHAHGSEVPGWMRKQPQLPPGWTHNHAGKQPHGWAMRAWARCVFRARPQDGAKTFDTEAACGARPVPPGHAGPHR